MTAILTQMGVPTGAILQEPLSLNTYEKCGKCQENPRRPWHSPGVTGDFCDAYAASASHFQASGVLQFLHPQTFVTNNELQEPQNPKPHC